MRHQSWTCHGVLCVVALAACGPDGVPLEVGTRPLAEQAKLMAGDARPFDGFGESVAVSGGTAVVGAPWREGFRGAAYVFERHRGAWSQVARLVASDGGLADLFGLSVAVSGDTVMVTAPYHNDSRGAVYVFRRCSGGWSQVAKLMASDGVPGDLFGDSVAMSGATAVVGAPWRDGYRGAAYVFERHRGTWSQRARLVAGDGERDDLFGLSVAVSGGTVVVGAPWRAGRQGAAYVYRHHFGIWFQEAKLVASDGGQDDLFGSSVAVSRGTAVVGAAGRDDNRGAAYVFGHRHFCTWSQEAELTGDTADYGYFGDWVALSGDTAVVGAPWRDGNRGAVYVFERHGSTWGKEVELSDSAGEQGDGFGQSVAVRGRTVMVGVPRSERAPPSRAPGMVLVLERW